MTSARIPTSVMVSVGLHGGLLLFFGFLAREGPKQAPKVVEGVDLLINVPKPKPMQEMRAPKPPKLSTMDFLKLALPAAPRVAAPAQMNIKTPDRKIALADAPKLQDRSRKEVMPKLQGLDLSQRPIEAAKLDVKMSQRQAATTLAALPRLEDVGRKRVANLPQAMALEERRQEAVALAGMPEMSVKPSSRHQAVAAVAALQDAAPASSGGQPRHGLAALLPERPILDSRPQGLMVPQIQKVVETPKPQRRQALQVEATKKGVEIEGPLANRKVSAYRVPSFPEWARSQGILEADVAIRFTVDELGNVMSGMRVEHSSGYGRLDRLAMDALQEWRFAPKPGAGVQWGVITFRFVLE